jgi:glycosyltransferase involved in cell wall biosynthesis
VPETVRSIHTLVLGHDSSSNALGRALSMALVAERIGNVDVLAVGNDRVWPGASQFDFHVQQISGLLTSRLKHLVQSRSREADQLIVWVSKGIRPLPRLISVIQKAVPSAIVILDLDDDDAALAEGFRQRSNRNRLTLHGFRAMHPARIRAAQKRLAKMAAGTTLSTNFLGERLGVEGPKLRVPHSRVPTNTKTSDATISPKIRVGAFGTLRPHKGGALFMDLIDEFEELELVTFIDCGLGTPRPGQSNWKEISPTTPLSAAYASVDVTLIPMDDAAPGSDVQLPAKLIDAMRSGVPIVATPTPAIVEIADGYFVPLQRAADLDEVLLAIRTAVSSDLGSRAREVFTAELTPEVLSLRLLRFITEITAR